VSYWSWRFLLFGDVARRGEIARTDRVELADPAFAAATVVLAGLLLGQSFFLLATRPACR
jgi:hypothetical protein